MAKEKLFYIGVKALIENEKGEILLMEEETSDHSTPTDPYWDFPGGRIDVGEKVDDALAREMQEETGIAEFSKPEFFTAVISNHQIKQENGSMAGLALMVYKVEIASDSKITLSEEHTSYEWVAPQEAAERLQIKYPPELTRLIAQ
jgi:mutator protein MutT